MNFASYQSRGQLEAPYQHYTRPANLQADNSGQKMLARANVDLAKVNADTANVIVAGFNNWREQYDQGKVMEANNEYNRLMSEGTAELMQKKQENALNVVEDYDKLHQKSLEKVRKKYGQFINYGKAGQAFNIYTERDNNTRREHMMKYQMAETDAYHETQFNNQLATCIQTAADGGYTDMSIDQGLNRAEGFIEARYGQYGKEMVEQQKRIFKGQIVGNALQLAVNMGDYARMNSLCDKYSKLIDPKTLVTVKGLMMKRNREEKELSFHQQMINDIGVNASNEAVKEYLEKNWERLHPRTGNYKGSNAEAWKEAQWVSEKTGLPAEFVYRQWAHESAYFSSQLARENNNFGGLTQEEWNGDDNLQPDGNNYYREFRNFHEYAEAYVKDFINLYEGQENVRDLASFAHYLKLNGYYGADERDYLAAMENVEMESIDDEGSAEPNIPSGVEFENEYQEALKFRDNKRNLIQAENNRIIKTYGDRLQDLSNHGEATPEAIQNLISQAVFESGCDEHVRIKMETLGLAELSRQERAAKQAARRQPSEKVNETDMELVRDEISMGNADAASITKYCADRGITSATEINKLQKLLKDYKNNKGEWAIPYDDIKAYCDIDDRMIADKKSFNRTFKRIARFQYYKMLADNKGSLFSGWEEELADRVAKAFTDEYHGGQYVDRGTWMNTEENVILPYRILAANGYDTIRQTGDDGYVLESADGNYAYMTGEDLMKLKDISGYRD